jgi:hypothetical protein
MRASPSLLAKYADPPQECWADSRCSSILTLSVKEGAQALHFRRQPIPNLKS